MGEKREGNNKKTVEETTERLIQPYEARDSLFRIIQILLPGIGIFAALCYFLGRLRLEAYYSVLGMSPNALDFTPEDYMFSSFNLVVMCLMSFFLFYVYWQWATPGRKLFLGFPKNQKIMAIFVILLWIVAVFMFIFNIGGYMQGFAGLNAGAVIGIGAILFAWLLRISSGRGKESIIGIFLLTLLLFALIPLVTTRLAEMEAKADMVRFPQAVLICDDKLPNGLQSSSSNLTKSTEVKLITTNSGMTYVLKQDDESVDKWQIYAIPEDIIKTIIYLHEK